MNVPPAKRKKNCTALFFAHHFIVYELNLDVPEGEQPPPATNLTLTQEAGGWVLRWEPPKDENKSSVLYYSIQKKKDTQGEEWKNLAEYIDVDEASFMSKTQGAGSVVDLPKKYTDTNSCVFWCKMTLGTTFIEGVLPK